MSLTGVKVDDYWTIGGSGNDTLSPFNSTTDKSAYGYISNIAKVRLLPDGSNDLIEGTLTISADGQEDVVIHITDTPRQPEIVTEKLPEVAAGAGYNAVKYVPYSFYISTNNMYYEWNTQTFSIVEGSLPLGMGYTDSSGNLIQGSINPDTGEIYGAPTQSGSFSFKVRVDYSYPEFEASEKWFTMIVADNGDTTVYYTSDPDYTIKEEFFGIKYGNVGYFITFDFDELFISEGDHGVFTKLWINGVEIDKSRYTHESGSTKITIDSQNLNSLYNEGTIVDEKNTISIEFDETDKRGESMKRTSQNFYVKLKYSVTFELNGHGNPIQPKDIERNKCVTKPTDPRDANYNFDGWYTDKACTKVYDFNTPVTYNLTLYAKWTEKQTEPPVVVRYTVRFNMNGHGTAPGDKVVNAGQKIGRPTPDPQVLGYDFGGWYTDQACTKAFDFENTPVTQNLTLYAKWTEKQTERPTAATYTVTFYANGHGIAPAPKTVAAWQRVTNPGALTAEGYVFEGWYSDSALTILYNFSSPVTQDLILYAKWSEQPTDPSGNVRYTVRFDANGHGTAPSSVVVNAGATVSNPGTLTAAGYVFEGWYSDVALTNLYDFSIPVTQNLVLYAKWSEVQETTTEQEATTEQETTTEPVTTEEESFDETPVTCIMYVVNEEDKAINNQALELHSTPQSARTNTLGAATFSEVEFGDHTVYAMDEEGAEIASKDFTIKVGKSASLSGNTITAKGGSTITVKMELAQGELKLISVQEGNQVPIEDPAQTGDTSNTWLWILMFAGSLAAIAFAIHQLYRKEQN